MPKNPFENDDGKVTPISKGHEYRKARQEEFTKALHAKIQANKEREERATFKAEGEFEQNSLEQEIQTILQRLQTSAPGDMVLTYQAEEMIVDLHHLQEEYGVVNLQEEITEVGKIIENLEQALEIYIRKEV